MTQTPPATQRNLTKNANGALLQPEVASGDAMCSATYTHIVLCGAVKNLELRRKKKKKRIMAEDIARFTFLTLRWQIIRIHDRNIWIFLVSFRATKKCLYLISSHWSRSTVQCSPYYCWYYYGSLGLINIYCLCNPLENIIMVYVSFTWMQ